MSEPDGGAARRPVGDAASAASSDETVPEDETRRKFRAALQRKQQHSHATAEGAEKDGSEKSHGATGPTKGRTFRRKSV